MLQLFHTEQGDIPSAGATVKESVVPFCPFSFEIQIIFFPTNLMFIEFDVLQYIRTHHPL